MPNPSELALHPDPKTVSLAELEELLATFRQQFMHARTAFLLARDATASAGGPNGTWTENPPVLPEPTAAQLAAVNVRVFKSQPGAMAGLHTWAKYLHARSLGTAIRTRLREVKARSGTEAAIRWGCAVQALLGVGGRKVRAKTLRMTPAMLKLRRLQGRYIGLLRSLRLRHESRLANRLRAICKKRGVSVALAEAKKRGWC